MSDCAASLYALSADCGGHEKAAVSDEGEQVERRAAVLEALDGALKLSRGHTPREGIHP
jgi:hypothetical protein